MRKLGLFEESARFKMPIWSSANRRLDVIGFTGIALATQQRQYLLAEVVLICMALAAWAGSTKWSPPRIDAADAEPEARGLNPIPRATPNADR